ncbi:Uncharacterised protein [Mycobacteroides abscessus subsp. abscessus]|uniref:hypothetical protein n=1 Tax=Mycobacteroides abscessus TaxID=36809 RepID=UPI00092C9518|nr:hypothetical protein [Mycobacteroides abscessus]SHQ67462.1 Uncharacterised protein [Mycobacteroides abscessus subsp. abscessus]SHR90950.1 Uncharacterised protein [Mycobacteroides abscessus subsp. abscessus]SIH64171.1 Uncharacterised protein [Mycobacteroides abscessus subsp. abscessus]
MSSRHIYVDETKQRDYLLVASVHIGDDIEALRGVIRQLLLPGQRYLHMKDENDGRKRTIAAALVAADIKATVYRAGTEHRTHNQRRAACLGGLIQDHAHGPETLLIIDQDDSLVSFDNQRLIEYTRAAGCRATLRYEHRSDKTELLLAVPDAIAWCWAKGGHWRTLITPAVSEVRDV